MISADWRSFCCCCSISQIKYCDKNGWKIVFPCVKCLWFLQFLLKHCWIILGVVERRWWVGGRITRLLKTQVSGGVCEMLLTNLIFLIKDLVIPGKRPGTWLLLAVLSQWYALPLYTIYGKLNFSSASYFQGCYLSDYSDCNVPVSLITLR